MEKLTDIFIEIYSNYHKYDYEDICKKLIEKSGGTAYYTCEEKKEFVGEVKKIGKLLKNKEVK